MAKASKYDIYNHFEKHHRDVSTTSPAWALVFYHFKNHASFDKAAGKSQKDLLNGDGVKLEIKPFMVVSDCTQLTVQSSKSNHIHNLSAEIRHNAKFNYSNYIKPGDWVAAWMVTDRGQIKTLKKAIDEGKPANDFRSGFKFLGRVDSFFKDTNQAASGKRTARYQLTASAFKELNTQIIYYPQLGNDVDKSTPAWMQKMGYDMSSIFRTDTSGNVFNNVEDVIVRLFQIMLGEGVRKDAGGVNTGQGVVPNSTYGGGLGSNASAGPSTADKNAFKSAPLAYMVPKELCDLLGRQISGEYASYAHLLDILSGVQNYTPGNVDTDSAAAGSFQPEITSDRLGLGSQTNVRTTPKSLSGVFLLAGITFTNKPMWSIMEQYLNKDINEMYTCFRVNDKGNIVPTVVLRQQPHTSERFDLDSIKKTFGDNEKIYKENFSVTKFSNVPRWVIDPKMVTNSRLGTSAATHTNFVFLTIADSYQRGVTYPQQAALNPPIWDAIDIQRTGIQAWQGTLSMTTASQVYHIPRAFMHLVADRMINSHLTYNGALNCVGIQAPIVPGDNIQLMDGVFHVEAVTHNCVMVDKKRRFTTSLALSFGVKDPELVEDANSDEPYYLNLMNTDEDGTIESLDPGSTTLKNPITDDDFENSGVSESAEIAEDDDFNKGLA